MGQTVRQTLRLGGGKHRRNIQLLPLAAAASQEPEIDQHAGALDGRAQAPDAGGADLSECGRLLTACACARGGDTRELDRGDAVSQHGSLAGAKERSFTQAGRCGVKVSTGLTRARRSQAALALDPIPASKVQ